MVAASERHLALNCRVIEQKASLPSREEEGRGGARRKGKWLEAQRLPTIHAPSGNVRVVEQSSSSLPLSSRQTVISASGKVDCNNNCKGPKARTVAQVAARPPAPLHTGKEPAEGAGVKNNDRMKGRNADGRDAHKTNMPGLPRPPTVRSVGAHCEGWLRFYV
jgi:hypothetical protein